MGRGVSQRDFKRETCLSRIADILGRATNRRANRRVPREETMATTAAAHRELFLFICARALPEDPLTRSKLHLMNGG